MLRYYRISSLTYPIPLLAICKIRRGLGLREVNVLEVFPLSHWLRSLPPRVLFPRRRRHLVQFVFGTLCDTYILPKTSQSLEECWIHVYTDLNHSFIQGFFNTLWFQKHLIYDLHYISLFGIIEEHNFTS